MRNTEVLYRIEGSQKVKRTIIICLLLVLVILFSVDYRLSYLWKVKAPVMLFGGGHVSDDDTNTTKQNSDHWFASRVTSVNGTKLIEQRSISDEINSIADKHHVVDVNCALMFEDNKQAMSEAAALKAKTKEILSDDSYISAAEDCVSYRATRGYVTNSLTQEEERFPIAYSMVVYKDSEMVERLLRSIYRPQNSYCIHVDMKASESFLKAMSAIVRCFGNVFLSSKRVSVKWGTFSVLEPELVCMNELWRYKKWKYFINLTGQEFPLKTNFELVRILKAYNGANNIEGTILHANEGRWKNTTPPFGLRPVKGSVHITASRNFVDFILHNATSQGLLEWVERVDIPDEAFFSTLNYNPQLGIKGTFKGNPDDNRHFLTRYKIWEGNANCAGKFVREVCILTIGDLPRLSQAKELFANKFFIKEDRLVISCLEEKLLNTTRDEYLGNTHFNDTLYRNLDFVLNQVA
ncbi:unnamed protein product [Lymnaea stagnalis]|uniref:Beta-1,3-galactosyl-O-glycosyl-glycoprotein beta-1,6-N-acetylglucosaminyltransferase n=1 Tax=Lymnaea stagnalis TaxID=6523 RepID=A0AAV2H6I3_LYMST